MVDHLDEATGTFGRRRFLQGAAAATAVSGLAWPQAGLAHNGDDDDAEHAFPLAAPKPIPGGSQIPGGPLIHVFAPGPQGVTLPFTGVPLEGLDVEPSTITDFRGFTALAYLVGTATGGDGKAHDLEVDIRAYKGDYVDVNGTRRSGQFAFIWIDLFEPGSGSPPVQLHDFNGGVPPSGLFWTVGLSDEDVEIGRRGRSATLAARNVPLIDNFQFLGPNQVPATCSFKVEWEATGPPQQLGKGTAVPPDSSAGFLASFAPARATGSFSGSELGFSFRSNPGASSDRGYAELGPERNGVFL